MWRLALKHVPRPPHAPLLPQRTSSKTSLLTNNYCKRDFHVTKANAVKKSQASHGVWNKVKNSILLLEAKQGPFGRIAVGLGQSAAAAGLTFGAGATAYYLFADKKKNEEDLLVPALESERTVSWTFGGGDIPEYAQARLHSTYMYLANSVSVTALGAFASFRLFNKHFILNSVASNPILYFGMAMGSQFLLTMLVRYGNEH